MKRAYSHAEIIAAEQNSGVPEGELMRRAGRALADVLRERARKMNVSDILFVCGGGNNGGDGLVAAQLLLEEGYDVSVLCLAERFSPACAAAKELFRGEILGKIPRRRYALLADCLFGTGLSRAPDGENADLVGFLNGYVVSCDVPSGLTAGGIALEPCVRADCTVSLGGLKQALLLADGADVAGEIVVADIGLSPAGGAEIWEEEDVAAYFPPKRSHSDKGKYGRVAVLAGKGSLGAPLMAAGGALRSGAGYTELLFPASEHAETDEIRRTILSAKFPPCIVSAYRGEPLRSAVLFGPGAGVGEWQRDTVKSLLVHEGGTLVLDADALNTLAAFGKDILKRKRRPVVITPHIKEFSVLTGKSISYIQSDPVACAREFSNEYGVTVVLKDNRTVIAEGDRVAINITGSPVLAKGGSGDTLAGLLAGTCARGVPPFEAAAISCYLLGRAGELAAAEMGEYAPDADDLLAYLPRAMKF